MQKIIIKKKKKKGLYISFGSLTQDEAIQSIHDIRVKLIKVFRSHIGLENAITPVQLFQEVFRVDPDSVNVFQRNYWWGIIERVLRQLRSEETLFVINKRVKLFVLRSQDELTLYKKGVDAHIENLKGMKVKADRWISEEKWRDIK